MDTAQKVSILKYIRCDFLIVINQEFKKNQNQNLTAV